METHPLSLAHQQHRRAQAYSASNRYDEALQCHYKAAEHLLNAMKSTTSSVALESITLQYNYHLKQKELIKIKKEQYARVKKAMADLNLMKKDPFSLQFSELSSLQMDMCRTINENEPLGNECPQPNLVRHLSLHPPIIDVHRRVSL